MAQSTYIVLIMVLCVLPTILMAKETYQALDHYYGNSDYARKTAFDHAFSTRQDVNGFTPTDAVNLALLSVSHMLRRIY